VNGGMPAPGGSAAPDALQAFSATELPLGADGVGLCYGCRPLNRCRLGVTRLDLGNDGVLRVEATCPPEREGLRGVAHGGWTADLFDDVLGRRLSLASTFAVTRSLTVEFVRPVPIGHLLSLTAVLADADEQQPLVQGTLVLASSGAVLATAVSAFTVRDEVHHFRRFERWLNGEA
jgi:hypothetical protein